MADESGGVLAGIGSKLGAGAASLGKKVAQSEAGRSAGKAAVRGATDAAAKDLTDRYFGAGYAQNVASTPQPPPPKTETVAKSSPSAEPQDQSSPPEPHSQEGEKQVYSTLIGGQETYGRQEKASIFSKIIPTGLPELLTTKSSSSSRPKPKVYKRVINTEADWDSLPLAQALYNFRAEMKCDLEFRKGQVIKVLTSTDSTDDWWEGRIDDRTGIFPANYVKLLR